MEEKVIQDLDHHLSNLKDLKDWLGQVYYNEEFASFMQKPVLSILSSAVQHLIDNLKIIRSRHLEE